MGVSYFHMGLKIYYTDQTKTKFNYRFLFYIRFFRGSHGTQGTQRKQKTT